MFGATFNLKDEKNSLASNYCFSYSNVFQNGVNNG